MKQIFYMYPQQGIGMFDSVPEPQISLPDDVKIKIEYAAICGSDAHMAHGANDHLFEMYGLPKGTPIPLGHESTGIVVEIGSAVTTCKVGDRVTVNTVIPCGKCHSCRSGHENLCEAPQAVRGGGAMAEYLILPDSEVFKLPDHLSSLHATLAEPLHIAMESIEKAQIKPGQSVAIIGGGPIGMLTLQVAKNSGAYPIVLFDITEEKLNFAKALGADKAINSKDEDALAQALSLTEGYGFDKVIECSGTPRVLDLSVNLLGKGGNLVITSVYPGGSKYEVDLGTLFAKELTIKASYVAPNTYQRALNLLNRIDCEKTITAIYPIDEYEKAFEAHNNGKNIKVVIKF